jgi:hypothetical protein
VIVALRSGVAVDDWLCDTRALTTAVELYREQDRAENRAARRRR